MSTSIEFRGRLDDFLQGRITLDQLEAWLAPRLAAILSEPDTELAHVAATVELCLAEVADGIRSPRTVKPLLRNQLAQRDHAAPVMRPFSAARQD